MPLGTGETFAGYRVVRRLGSGGMGDVYLAQHARLPRYEALKVLRPNMASDETFRKRFIREAESVAALQHPHIVTVFDRGESEGQMWIATEFIDGTNAAEFIRDHHPAGMPVDEVIPIVTAIGAALDYAHDRGLLHRDVKPGNILLTQPDRDGSRLAYLADFGIARPLDDPAGLTSTNFAIGTFAYAAPEQLMGTAIDGRADQYALAATTYHLLTGKQVFPDSNPVAVIGQHLTQPAPTPSGIRSDLATFDAAFARALAKNPTDRFPRCRDFADALATAATSSGLAYPANASTQQSPIATNLESPQMEGPVRTPPEERVSVPPEEFIRSPNESPQSPPAVNGRSLGFWDHVGIAPIRVVNQRWRTKDFVTLRCYLDNLPLFLGHNGFISIFKSPRALVRYLRNSADHDLIGLDTYPEVLAAAIRDELEIRISEDNIYVLSGLVEDIRDGARDFDPYQFAEAVEFVRDVGEYTRFEEIECLLEIGTDLGDLVNGRKSKLDYIRASLQWEQVEGLVESRLHLR